MRSLVAFLLVVNLGVFAWGLLSSPTHGQDPLARLLPRGLPTLELVAASKDSSGEARVESDSSPVAPALPTPGAPPPAAATPDDSSLAAGARSGDEAVPESGVEAMPESRAEDETAATSSASVAPPLPGEAPSVSAAAEEAAAPVALGETTATQPPEPSADSSSLSWESEPSGAARVCFGVGPVESERELQGLRKRLERIGAKIEVRTAEEERVDRYWVLLPPLASDELARARMRELQAKGVQDLWRVPNGPDRNAISLGLFGGRANAERQQAQMRELGFDAEIRPRSHKITRFWIDAELGAPADEDRGPLLRRLRRTVARVEPRPCPEIVTE